MGKIKRTRLIYKAPEEQAISYIADTCIFATKNDEKEDVNTFMDGEVADILKMFVGLFRNLLKQNADLAYYFIDACMKILSEAVNIIPDEIEEEVDTDVENLLNDN